MSNCVIIFPIYKKPSSLELTFLENGINKTKGFKQVIIAPEGLVIDESFGLLEKLEVKRFAKYYFESIKGYNQLLLAKGFYTAFSLYDYMLIHQADVYLFNEDLKQWCEKKYDYIGAPWFRPDKLNKGKFFNFIEQTKLSFSKNKVYGDRYNKVGNGGLSLRKVSTALAVLNKVSKPLLDQYTKTESSEFNEDIFWSLEAPQIISDYAIPQWQEAMSFAIEFQPAVAFEYLKEKLPFGCHAPHKHDIGFWKNFIPGL